MKILVTGATGFIGHHVVQWLTDQEYDVVATGTSEEKAKKFAWYNSVDFIPCNYYSENRDYFEYFNKPDILIHLAWKNVHNVMDISNITDTLFREINFYKSFVNADMKKIVGIGSCHEYGLVNGCCSEDMPTNPINPYAISKDTLRRYLALSVVKRKTPFNWIRIFFAYGEGQNKKSLIPQLNYAILHGDKEFPMTGGEQLRDYLPIEKIAEYIGKISLQKDTLGVVNCCSGDMISVRRLIEEMILEKNATISPKFGMYPYIPYEGMAFWGDTKKLRECLHNYDTGRKYNSNPIKYIICNNDS